MVCYRMLFKSLERVLSNRYNIKLNDNDWKDVESYLIAELENILNIKVTSHKELVDALNQLKKLYPSSFLKLEDILKTKLREKRDPLKIKRNKKKIKNDTKSENEDKSEGSGKSETFNRKKKKKINTEYIYQ